MVFSRANVSVLFLLVVALLALKSPDALWMPQFWAEDGPIFFAEQYQHVWPRLLTPYAGYLHTMPRLVAWIASWFATSSAPLIFNAFAITIDAAAIVFVTVRLAHWCPPVVVLLSFFVVPTAGDIFGTITNVQWFTQFALVAACFAPQESNTQRATPLLRFLGFLALALTALTGPFSVILTFMAVAILLGSMASTKPGTTAHTLVEAMRETVRSWRRWELATVAVCALIQLGAMLGSERIRASWESYALTAAQQVSLGVDRTQSFYSYTVNHPFALSHIVGLVVVAMVWGAMLVDAVRCQRLGGNLAVHIFAIGSLQPLLAFAKQRQWNALAVSSHYFYMLNVGACWVAWRLISKYVPGYRRHAAALIALAVVASAALQPNYFRREPFPDLGWAGYARKITIGGGERIVVPINPVPWSFTVPGKTGDVAAP